LGELATPYPRRGGGFFYPFPAEPHYCLKARRFEAERDWDSDTRVHPGQRPFRVEGRFILTDVETPTLIYTQRIVDINLFDSLLFQATATLLASHFAIALRQDYKRQEGLYSAWLGMQAEAAGLDEAEGGKDTYLSTDLISDR